MVSRIARSRIVTAALTWPRKAAVIVLSAAVVLLFGWAITSCTVGNGLDRLPPEFSSTGRTGVQATGTSPDAPPDFAITSNGETTIPYENPLWAELWTEQGWVARYSLTVFYNLEAALDELPTVTLREDITLSHADNVSLGGLYVCRADDLEIIYEDAGRLLLTGLPEGTYYVAIRARKTGDYIESEEKHEMYGSEYVFRFVVDERSYDRLLRSRPASEGISVMLRPTEHTGSWYSRGEAGYCVPADQDVWLAAFERAAANATEQGWPDREGPTGVWIKHNEDYWCFTDGGCLVRPGANPRCIGAPDAAELLTLVRAVAEKYGVNMGVFRPDAIQSIISATLSLRGETHTVTDPEVLAELEDLLTSATRLRVVTKCPSEALLTLELESGNRLRIAVATDSCRVYMVDGVYFEYGSEDNAEFFGLFGATLE